MEERERATVNMLAGIFLFPCSSPQPPSGVVRISAVLRRRFRGSCLGPCRRRQLAMKSSSAAASPAARPCKRAASIPPPRIAGRGCPTCHTGCIMRRQAQVWCLSQDNPPPGVCSLPFTQPCHLQSSSLGRQSLHPASPVAVPLHAVFAHFEFILAVRPVISHRW